MRYQGMGNTRPACLRDLDGMRHWAWCVCRRWPRPRVGSGRAPNVRKKPFHYSIGEVMRVCCAAILRQEEFHLPSFICCCCCCCCCGKGDFNGRTGWAWAIKNWVEISPAVRLGHRERERAISCRKARPRDGRNTHATSGLEPTSRSADGATWTVWSGHRRRRRRRRRWTRAGAR